MNAEFNWWLLIVGLVVGAGLVWLVIADWSRREEDLSADERQTESAWISQALRERGDALDPADAETVLALHRAYLRQMGGFVEDGLARPTTYSEDPLDAEGDNWLHTAPDHDRAPDGAPDYRRVDAPNRTDAATRPAYGGSRPTDVGRDAPAGFVDRDAPARDDLTDLEADDLRRLHESRRARGSVRARPLDPRGGAEGLGGAGAPGAAGLGSDPPRPS